MENSSGVIYTVIIHVPACLPQNLKELIIKRHEGAKKCA